MSLGDEFFGKKAMPSRVLSVKILELWGFMFREIVFFTSLPSRRPCWQFIGNPEKKEGEYLYRRGKLQENVKAIKIARNPRYTYIV